MNQALQILRKCSGQSVRRLQYTRSSMIRTIGIDGRLREDRFPAFQRKLSLDHDEIAITVGGAAFNDRIQSLYGFFDSYRLK